MNKEEIKQGIELLIKTSKEVQQYYENEEHLIEALNKVPKEELEKCLDFYKNRQGVIIDLRKELIHNLNNSNKYTLESIYKLINKHKKGKENQFKSYKQLFTVFYPPITFYGHNKQRDFANSFVNKLIEDLKLKDKVKITKYDFQGSRQQGSDRFWIAIYNAAQESQSSSLQIFIEFHHGKINYGIYKHSDKSYLTERQQFNEVSFDYDKMLQYFQNQKDLILNDVPVFKNVKQVALNGSRLFKISHGTFKAKKYSKVLDDLKDNNWIVIHEETQKGQAEAFKNDLKKGDFVYIVAGSDKLIGVAKIVSDGYDYVPNDITDSDSWLYREVEMIQQAIRPHSKDLKDSRFHLPSGNSTLVEVKPHDIKETNEILFKPYFNVEFIMEANSLNKENNYTPSLNQIFYGPPGTGKTYNTVLEAAKIITGNESISYEGALEVFNNHLGDQIEFITFHQNYSYEDFIQGLRPETESEGVLSFYKKDGVFKKIADKALKNFKASNTEVQKKRDFSEVFEEFIAPLIEGEKNEIEIEMKKVSFFITNIKDKSIEFRKTSGGTDHTLSIKTLEEMYNEESTKNIQGLTSYYRPLLNELLRKGKLNEAEHISLKNYVIIIDEINRANISRVFGELITLIEKDKRFGGKTPLTATLPSGEKFIVPSNLYIIGTMNTADKSIALLDIALRRRFEFKPMYPDYEVENIHKAAFLKSLNDLIVKSNKGHDFTIGHAYFMCDENEAFDFENTINNKVIPLLLEYFMNDDNEVIKILNEALKLEDTKVGGWPLKLLSNGN